MANALAIVDKAFSSLKTSDAEKAAGYVKGLETRLARTQRDVEARESMPAKLAADGMRLAGAALRGGAERLADGYGQGAAFRNIAPYVAAAGWGAGLASGWDIVRELAGGALAVEAYEAARGQDVRHRAAAEALAIDPRYSEAAAYLRSASAPKKADKKEETKG